MSGGWYEADLIDTCEVLRQQGFYEMDAKMHLRLLRWLCDDIIDAPEIKAMLEARHEARIGILRDRAEDEQEVRNPSLTQPGACGGRGTNPQIYALKPEPCYPSAGAAPAEGGGGGGAAPAEGGGRG